MKRLITKSATKRATAVAMAEAKRHNDWSNADLGAAIDASESTVRNRLDGDTSDHQMTVYELARAVSAGEVSLANAILRGLTGYHLVPDTSGSAPSALDAAARSAQCAADLIAAAPDGIDPGEAAALLPSIIAMRESMAALEVHFRELVPGRPTRRPAMGRR